MDSLLYLLIGAYTMGLSDGINVYKFNAATGQSTYVGQTVVDNPSYFEISNGTYIYAVSENPDNRIDEEDESDGVSCYANTLRFDKATGTLNLLNSQETFAASPCYIIADSARRYAVTANYGGGSISVFPIVGDTLQAASQMIIFEGSGADSTRQSMPHLHCVKLSPDGKFIFSADLGTDKIYRHDINPGTEPFIREETLKSFTLPPGSGPRHLTFHPNGRYLYLINELSGAVTAFNYNNGDIDAFQTIQADTVGGRASADILISPDGNFLYASNRNKADGIAIFSINAENGRLAKVGYQPTAKHPRNFTLSPDGRFLLAACMNSNVIEVFAVDKQTGLLSKTDYNITELDTPVCVKFVY
ncbi:MAG: lactonase family protein [Tannerellaceae bacterium]|jgi:6-phosphogluconolactonase (cycloisomerase 2 family)|nr:lactonase family protein [Tannerellaceae bacterium]